MISAEILYRGALEIQAVVESEPRLSGFAEATQELVANAQRLLAGDLAIRPLKNPSKALLPDRETAQRIVSIVSQIPGPDGDEGEEFVRAVAQFHGNLVEAVMHAVFAEYSDVVREDMGPDCDDAG